MLRRFTFAVLSLAGLCLSDVQAATINPVVDYTTTSTLTDFRPFTLGYKFSLSNSITVNALGYWVDGNSNSHQVGLWDSIGNLITSTTVVGADSVVGNFQWSSIPNVNLTPGTYIIAGEYLGNNDLFPHNALGVNTAPGYAWIEDLQVFGAGLNFPTVTTSGGYGNNGIIIVSLSTTDSVDVPEPTTAALLCIGITGLVGCRLRKRKLVQA